LRLIKIGERGRLPPAQSQGTRPAITIAFSTGSKGRRAGLRAPRAVTRNRRSRRTGWRSRRLPP